MTNTQLVCLYLPPPFCQQERWREKKALFVSCLLRNEVKEVQDGLSLNLPSLPLGLNAILVSVSAVLGWVTDNEAHEGARSNSGTLWGDLMDLGQYACTFSASLWCPHRVMCPRTWSSSVWNQFLWEYGGNQMTMHGSPKSPWVSSYSVLPLGHQASSHEEWAIDLETAFVLPRACLHYLLEMVVHSANLVLVMGKWDLALSWDDFRG